MKVLLDTNIILDAFIKREPFCAAAEKLITMVAAQEMEGYLTSNQITDIYYFLARYLKNDAKEVLQKILFLFEILPVTGADCRAALAVEMADYEDALIVTCAKNGKLNYIITRNKQDFTEKSIAVETPNEFLSHCG